MMQKNETKHKMEEDDQSGNEAFIRQMKVKNTILKKMLTEIEHGPLSHTKDIYSADLLAEDIMIEDIHDEDLHDEDLHDEDLHAQEEMTSENEKHETKY